MKLHKRPRARLAVAVMFAVALVSTIGAGITVAVAQEPLPEMCASRERASHHVRASGPLCATESAPEQTRAQAAGCIYYGTPYKQEMLVTDANGKTRCVPGIEAAAIAEGAGWPNFDSTAFGDQLELVKSAGEEAAAWPDFDPTDMTREIAQYEAEQEAASWPNFDPTDMTREIAQYEAEQEAASWPNFDSTAFSSGTTTASAGNDQGTAQIAGHPQSGNAF